MEPRLRLPEQLPQRLRGTLPSKRNPSVNDTPASMPRINPSPISTVIAHPRPFRLQPTLSRACFGADSVGCVLICSLACSYPPSKDASGGAGRHTLHGR
jgi:hypothetical protein